MRNCLNSSDVCASFVIASETYSRSSHKETAETRLFLKVLCDLTQVADNKGVKLIQERGEATLVGNDPLP